MGGYIIREAYEMIKSVARKREHGKNGGCRMNRSKPDELSEQVKDDLKAENSQLKMDLSSSRERENVLRSKLKALVYDCTASDFNEHWESYQQAVEELES